MANFICFTKIKNLKLKLKERPQKFTEIEMVNNSECSPCLSKIKPKEHLLKPRVESLLFCKPWMFEDTKQ
jgi:hypothetical protein